MIQEIIRLKNDMVMVFDEEGEQLPRYQGRYDEVKDLILADAPAGAVFNNWFDHSPKPDTLPAKRWKNGG
jgi:hypothetical protein